MKRQAKQQRNLALAKKVWGHLSRVSLEALEELTATYSLSVALGDIQHIDGRWYVTHAGLLRLANRNKCRGIHVHRMRELCDPDTNRWVFRATVYKILGSKGFAGYGDADPSNVSAFVRGAEMRVAETRAVNRALRKAYGIGLCSVEELGWSPRPSENNQTAQAKAFSTGSNGHHRSEPRLRDQLCLLIRQYSLDPTLVKAYAAHFCGTETLKEASRDLVESFVSHLAASAKEDRDGLICKLNSYAQPVEVKQ